MMPPANIITKPLRYRESDNRTDDGGPWKPGIHMFCRDSRFDLDLTGVRAEGYLALAKSDPIRETLRAGYRALWDDINNPSIWRAANP